MRYIKYFLPMAFAALAACSEKPTTPNPTATKINLGGTPDMTKNMNVARQNPAIQHDALWTQNFDISDIAQFDVLAEWEAMDDNQTNLATNRNGKSLNATTELVLPHSKWTAAKKPEFISWDKILAESTADSVNFATDGRPGVRVDRPVIILELTAEIANDAELFEKFIDNAVLDYPTGKIDLDFGGLSPNVKKETLADLFCKEIPGGRVRADGITFTSIQGDEWSINAGFRTVNWYLYSTTNGKIPAMLWKCENYNADMRAKIIIGGITKENIISEHPDGGPTAIEFGCISENLMPPPNTLKLVDQPDVCYFEIDMQNTIIVPEQGSELDERLIQTPKNLQDLIQNGRDTQNWLYERNIIVGKTATHGPGIRVLTAKQIKEFYPNITPMSAPNYQR